MHAAKLNRVVRRLRAASPPAAGTTDRLLLRAFAVRGDQSAFAELVSRHGAMVLRVCRRVLHHEHDAEDAFQATFLVLARKATSIRRSEALASWLHGVAHRIALQAQRDAGRRRAREREAQTMTSTAATDETDWREVQSALDEEIRALPEKLRAPFVLCFLEGKSRSEAAGELGVKEGTIWSRLSQARTHLQKRLGRRGIELPALLAAAAVAGGVAQSVPARLLESTVLSALPAGGVPARVAALARAASRAESATRAKAVLVGLVATGFLAFGAVFLKADGPAPPAKDEGAPIKAAGTEQPGPAEMKSAADPDPEDPKLAGRFRGRVFGPDGKPLGGARVFAVPFHAVSRGSGPVRATTGDDGRFEFDAPDLTYTAFDGLPARREGLLIAMKAGYAADWFHTWGHQTGRGFRTHWDPVQGAEVKLYLAKDDVPIHGRFLDADGRPLVGASVRLTELMIPRGRDLDAHLDREKKRPIFAMTDYERAVDPSRLPGLTTETRTDDDGRFTFKGIGRDRLVTVTVRSPTVVNTELTVMARDASDVETIPDVDKKPTQVIHGVGFTLRLKRGLTVRGRVIDRDSREPIPGMWVGPLQNAVNEFSSSLYPWVTDEKGRFTITGLDPRIREFDKVHRTIVAAAKPGLPYQTAWIEAKSDEDVVIECRRGIPFDLKLVDENGRPVEAKVTYVDVQANANVVRDEVIWPVGHAARKADGTYQGFVLPGPGAVLVKTSRSPGYRPASVDPKAFFAPGRTDWNPEEQATAYGTRDALTTSQGRYIGTIYRGGTIDQRDYSAIVLVNPAPDSARLRLSATVVRDRPRTVSLVDPDGKPLAGAHAHLYKRHGPYAIEEHLRGASFRLFGLVPDRDQFITFVHEDRKLIGFLKARGDGEAPYTVRMEPWGAVTGRFVGPDGKPAGPFWPGPSVRNDDPNGSTHYDFKNEEGGRFRIDGLVPGQSYNCDRIFSGIGTTFPAKMFEKLVLRPAEVRDLGDVRVEPDGGKGR